MAIVTVEVNSALNGVLIKTAEEKANWLNALRLARHGTAAERTEYTARLQQSGAGPYLLELAAEEYINALWFLYYYYANKLTNYDQFAAQYADVVQIRDTSGSLTLPDYITAQLNAQSTSSAHSGSSSSHSGSSSSHSGSSSSHTTSTANNVITTTSGSASSQPETGTSTPAHTGSSTSTPATSGSTSNHSGSSSSHAGTPSYGANPYKPSGGATYLNPADGVWQFKLNNGTDYSTSDYDEALLIEAALSQVGKGPRPGAQSWTLSNGQTFTNYDDAWNRYETELAQKLQELASGGGLSEQELLAQLMQQQASEGEEYSYTTTPATFTSETKKSNSIWWIVGGAAAAIAIGLLLTDNK